MSEFLKRKPLHNRNEEWKDHWNDMPEYICNDLTPEYQIIVSFKTKEDRKAFAKLLDQQISDKTKSLWYPKEEQDKVGHLRYVNK
jgi:5'-deoxynucleotidase YfbR-like HD superfamily hydrolase